MESPENTVYKIRFESSIRNDQARAYLEKYGFAKVYSVKNESLSSLIDEKNQNFESFSAWGVWKAENIYVILASKARWHSESEGFIDKAFLYVRASSIALLNEITNDAGSNGKKRIPIALGNGLYEIEDFAVEDLPEFKSIGQPMEKADFFKLRLFPYNESSLKKEKVAEMLVEEET